MAEVIESIPGFGLVCASEPAGKIGTDIATGFSMA